MSRRRAPVTRATSPRSAREPRTFWPRRIWFRFRAVVVEQADDPHAEPIGCGSDRPQHGRADVAGAVDEGRDGPDGFVAASAPPPVRIAGPPALPLRRCSDQEPCAAHAGEGQQALEHEERPREPADRRDGALDAKRHEHAVEEDEPDDRASGDDERDAKELADARVRPGPRVEPAQDVDRRPDDEAGRAPPGNRSARPRRTGACRSAAASRPRSRAR